MNTRIAFKLCSKFNKMIISISVYKLDEHQVHRLFHLFKIKFIIFKSVVFFFFSFLLFMKQFEGLVHCLSITAK